jgi:hypothetical protein
VRSNGTAEVLARAMSLLIARGAYREAARMYPDDLIELCMRALVIEKSRLLRSCSATLNDADRRMNWALRCLFERARRWRAENQRMRGPLVDEPSII